MQWNKILQCSPQQNQLFSNSKAQLGSRSRKSKLKSTPSSYKIKSKRQNQQLIQNSFSAVIGKLNYEEEDSKKSMGQISRTLTQIKKIQQQQLEYQKKFYILMEEQRGVREKTTAKKSMHNKSAANKSTIKKQKKSSMIEEQMSTKIRKLETDLKSIKLHLQNSRSVRKSGQKSKSMVRLPR